MMSVLDALGGAEPIIPLIRSGVARLRLDGAQTFPDGTYHMYLGQDSEARLFEDIEFQALYRGDLAEGLAIARLVGVTFYRMRMEGRSKTDLCPDCKVELLLGVGVACCLGCGWLSIDHTSKDDSMNDELIQKHFPETPTDQAIADANQAIRRVTQNQCDHSNTYCACAVNDISIKVNDSVRMRIARVVYGVEDPTLSWEQIETAIARQRKELHEQICKNIELRDAARAMLDCPSFNNKKQLEEKL